uniref:Uncharacterized protein n=1 Tax=Angiostrongylus cantonensis TaxID=6313 RepID=A0A0K0D560_ANGCA
MVYEMCTLSDFHLPVGIWDNAFIININGSSTHYIQHLGSSSKEHVKLVGNVRVEGEDAPLIGNGFTIATTRDVLENADSTTFLTQNDLLRHGSVIPDGLSVRIQVEFSCALRSGSESADLRNAAEKFTASLDRFTFARADKGILLRKNMDKTTLDNERPLDKFSFGALQYKDFIQLQAFRCLAFSSSTRDDRKMVPIVRITRDATSYFCILTTLDITVPAVFEDSSQVLYGHMVEGIRRKVTAMIYMMTDGFKNQQKMIPTVSQVFLPPGWSSLLHLQMLMSDEIEQHSARVRLHKLFNLPLSMPCIRSSQAITFAPTRLLRSPHIHINNCEFHHSPRAMLNVFFLFLFKFLQ